MTKVMTIGVVATETASDPTLSSVIKSILNIKWYRQGEKADSKTIQTLYLFRNELSLVYAYRVSFHKKAVDVAESGHQGILKTRENV